MNEAVARMLERYDCDSLADHLQALREILQEIALLGLWRSKFFDKAAFYGDTALRILYGLDRFSEDMDFSLLSPIPNFDLSAYMAAQQKELAAFGFDVRVEQRNKSACNRVQSAFLKANTLNQLLVIATSEDIVQAVHRGQVLKIKLEVDTDPPPEFNPFLKSAEIQPVLTRLRCIGAARGCIIACMDHLEKKGVLKKKFKNRFRKET